MSQRYREGWELLFGPPPPKMHQCLFNLRRGMIIDLNLPDDLKLADLHRFVQYLATMCDDWEPEMGLPKIIFPDTKT